MYHIYDSDGGYIATITIDKLTSALKYAINELREWNSESEAANELEEVLNDIDSGGGIEDGK